jgi:DNA-binding HxlR family transcriptional regulator
VSYKRRITVVGLFNNALTRSNVGIKFRSNISAQETRELDESGILERQAYNEIPPRVEYRLTSKGQELVESIIYLLNWMKKWAKD